MDRSSASAFLRHALLPFLGLMVTVSIWDQRLFFMILGIWSIYLIAYPLYRGRCVREPLMTISAILLSLPFLVYALDRALDLPWVFWVRLSELMAVYAVGLFTFVHLVSYHDMRLDRLSLVFLCTVSTISMGMVFMLGQYLNNLIFKTVFIESNSILMQDLALTSIGALAMSSLLYMYMVRKGIRIIRSLEEESCQEVKG
ncbi:MAG: hypothetical protein PHW93_03355 [Candidatus Methanomethylophilaceae archaeon]|nr:hypothetical protein [Candidatus Methanomethylophilaceae archaeon]